MKQMQGILGFQTDDSAIAKALELVDSLAKDRTLEEIQELTAQGKLQDLFPDLFADELTPELPKFDDLEQAPSGRLTDRKFEELLRHS